MTNDNEDRKITISLRVTIPCDRRIDISDVEVCGSTVPRVRKSESPKRIQEPHEGQSWKVKMEGSGPGVICAVGDGFDDADYVYGYCYPMGVTPDDDPPSGLDEADITDDYWCLEQIPGAVAGPCKLRVWFYDDDKFVTRDNVTFNGIASTHTECEGSVTGLAKAPARRVFFPSRLTAVASGFSDAVGFFNGTWTMDVKPCIQDVDRVAWRTADSPSGVVVELVANLEDESAALSFHKEPMEICYRKAAGEWNPANVCDFADVTSRAVPPATAIPAIIQVHPGETP